MSKKRTSPKTELELENHEPSNPKTEFTTQSDRLSRISETLKKYFPNQKAAKKARKADRRSRLSLTLLLTFTVFLILLGAISIAGIAAIVLWEFGLEESDLEVSHLIAYIIGISTLIGTLLSFLIVKFPLRPINRLIERINALADGKYDTRLEYKGMMSAIPCFETLSESFNKLASELGSTEMLRSDFINNFSHEFKTPIVSIAGFASLLRESDLSENERNQYLAAIEEESLRLSGMATAVLTLTKVENQAILSDVTEFNLAEALRSCLLLFVNKWEEKKIELSPEIRETTIEANEELIRQVMINLIDNAVKFTDKCGSINITLVNDGQNAVLEVENTGDTIPPEKLDKIWNKFYQADESHSGRGNGIGLAVVSRVTELHNGKVSVKSENGITVFTVILPLSQKQKVN